MIKMLLRPHELPVMVYLNMLVIDIKSDYIHNWHNGRSSRPAELAMGVEEKAVASVACCTRKTTTSLSIANVGTEIPTLRTATIRGSRSAWGSLYGGIKTMLTLVAV